jgi:selenocysteine lyase/cysteine desulfurase
MSSDGHGDSSLLLAPIEQILTCGGDTRLLLDPASRLNGYGCRPFPRPDAFTFASSTATSISGRAYAAAAAARQGLLRASNATGLAAAFAARMDALRGELKTLLGLAETGCEIVFSPSGTDSQLHTLLLARAALGTPLVNVIAASDETGSGTVFAALGRHFNALTAQGVKVVKGEMLAGMKDDVTLLGIPLRDAGGALRPDGVVDGAVADAVARAVAAGSRVLLHAMDSSKFGWRAPSLALLGDIARAHGDRVQIVVDACQMRLSRPRLRWYLEQGFMVLLTGSKFFTGPPFCGALVVPEGLSARIARIDRLPAGLADYTNRSDWPALWSALQRGLPARVNLGAWLRWVAALEEIRAYFATPATFRKLALAKFAEIVPLLIETGGLRLLPAQASTPPDGVADEEMSARTIFPFLLEREGQILSVAEAAILYRALNADVAALLPAVEHALASRPCHIGQPVAVKLLSGEVAGALRINAGARFVSESWSDAGERIALRNLWAEFDQVHVIIEKIRLLLRHFDAIERSYVAPPAYKASAA